MVCRVSKPIRHDQPSVLCPDSEPRHTEFGRTLYRQFCQLLHGERVMTLLSNWNFFAVLQHNQAKLSRVCNKIVLTNISLPQFFIKQKIPLYHVLYCTCLGQLVEWPMPFYVIIMTSCTFFKIKFLSTTTCRKSLKSRCLWQNKKNMHVLWGVNVCLRSQFTL